MAGGATAVIVDRWALMRLGVGAVLRAIGIQVVGEESRARDALMRARTERPDLLLFGNQLDVPVVEAVREAARLEHRPRILVLLGGTTRDHLTELFTAGADGAVLRSVSADELASSLDRLLAGERVLAPAFVPVMAGAVESPVDAMTTEHLTAKEREVLALLVGGSSNKEIAEALFIAPATVKTHLAHLYGKLGVKSRSEAVEHALANGMLE